MMRPSSLVPLIARTPAELRRAIHKFVACCTIEGDDGRTFVMPVPLPPGFRVPAEIVGKLPPWLKVTA